MKKYLFFLMLLPIALWSQNIDKVEYFFDTDPGFGFGTDVPVTAAMNIANLNIPINLSALPAGNHKLYIRTRDVNGLWSETTYSSFYKAATYTPPPLPTIVEMEYFINLDPGVGGATKIIISAATDIQNLNPSVCLTGAVNGANKIYFRTKDSNGLWSETINQDFTYSGTVPVSCTVLSVEFISFKGKNTEGGNLLTWETASEVNNKGFQVERLDASTNQWFVLGFASAKGKAATYNYVDKTKNDVSFYRLRQLDNEGKETVSKVISIAQKVSKTLKVYPTIASDYLVIETEKQEPYIIVNLLGQIISKGQVTPQIDISALSQGAYMIMVGEEKAKFIKQ
jgi:hypothetical protein